MGSTPAIFVIFFITSSKIKNKLNTQQNSFYKLNKTDKNTSQNPTNTYFLKPFNPTQQYKKNFNNFFKIKTKHLKNVYVKNSTSLFKKQLLTKKYNTHFISKPSLTKLYQRNFFVNNVRSSFITCRKSQTHQILKTLHLELTAVRKNSCQPDYHSSGPHTLYNNNVKNTKHVFNFTTNLSSQPVHYPPNLPPLNMLTNTSTIIDNRVVVKFPVYIQNTNITTPNRKHLPLNLLVVKLFLSKSLSKTISKLQFHNIQNSNFYNKYINLFLSNSPNENYLLHPNFIVHKSKKLYPIHRLQLPAKQLPKPTPVEFIKSLLPLPKSISVNSLPLPLKTSLLTTCDKKTHNNTYYTNKLNYSHRYLYTYVKKITNYQLPTINTSTPSTNTLAPNNTILQWSVFFKNKVIYLKNIRFSGKLTKLKFYFHYKQLKQKLAGRPNKYKKVINERGYKNLPCSYKIPFLFWDYIRPSNTPNTSQSGNDFPLNINSSKTNPNITTPSDTYLYNSYFTKIVNTRFSLLSDKINNTSLSTTNSKFVSKLFLSMSASSIFFHKHTTPFLKHTTAVANMRKKPITNPNQWFKPKNVSIQHHLWRHKLVSFFFLINPSQLKYLYTTNNISKSTSSLNNYLIHHYHNFFVTNTLSELNTTNLLPTKNFKYVFFKKLYTTVNLKKLHLNVNHTYHNTIIRFMENLSGNKTLLQFYPFVNQSITKYWLIKYKLWLPRLSFYEKKLGHKFFLEESRHILHLSFLFKDAKLLFSWLKAMILRISFWKTRLIFRFLKYLMLNFFYQTFPQIKIKGVKLKLKGKISSAGNSRKKLIIYRIGETSHSTLNLKVLNEVGTVVTFTGVMGLHVSIFF